jgi:DNA-binding MarR family transcriptional regulator
MDRLAQNGLIERVQDKDDRRRVVHELSDYGARAVGEMETRFRERIDRVFAKLDEQSLQRALAGLRELSDAYDSIEAEDAAGVEE